jgi:3',5'-cyclic AMP phosphodiesterase CpdA
MDTRCGRRFLPSFMVALALSTTLLVVSCGSGGMDVREEPMGDGKGTYSKNDYSFLVCGDPHGRTDLLAEIIAQAAPGEFLAVVGDITTGKGLEQMQGMKDFLDSTGIEYYAIPGDNDMPGGDRSVFQAVFGPDYYSVDMQDSRLFFLNDAVQGIGCPDEQLAWLRDEVSALGGEKLIIAFTHVPPGAPVDMGKSGFLERETESAREMLDILRQAGAAVLYCGHIHAYMLYSSGPPRVVVTGGAGADPHLSEEAGGFHHFLRVTVRGGEVSEEVIRL